MKNAIFLSAGVPDPKRSARFATTADPIAISSAVTALVDAILGRLPLIWGGHPAITPMIGVMAKYYGVPAPDWVKLYQSEFFAEEFPQENQQFANLVITPSINNNREDSLVGMRESMFSENQFRAGIFIGGMQGIIDEFEMFRMHHPEAQVIPVGSTGGAALELAQEYFRENPEFIQRMDYLELFHDVLRIEFGATRSL